MLDFIEHIFNISPKEYNSGDFVTDMAQAYADTHGTTLEHVLNIQGNYNDKVD